MSEFTAEEVRDYADACRLVHDGPAIADMLDAYAADIEHKQAAVTKAVVNKAIAAAMSACRERLS
jgi:hypothetical protein